MSAIWKVVKFIFWSCVFAGIILFCIALPKGINNAVEDYHTTHNAQCADKFGKGYEWRDGDRSPDICINNSNGQVRYP